MSVKVGKCIQETAAIDDAEVVDDALDDIERVLSSPPPPVEDHLAALAAQLSEEKRQERLSMHGALADVPSVTVDDDWASEDEAPTTEWRKGSSVPPPPASLQAVLEYIEQTRAQRDRLHDDDVTPRPAAVTIAPVAPSAEAPRRQLSPWLAAAAMIALAAVIVSYRLGPPAASAPSLAHAAKPTPALPADRALPATDNGAAVVDYGAPVQTQRLLVSVEPAEARLSVRGMDEAQGEPYAGPWPRAFDLAPGVYELVAFRRGQSIVSRVEIDPGVDPPPLALRIPVAD